MAHWVIRLFCSWMIQRYFEWILWMNGSLTHLHVLFLNDSALLGMNLLKEWLIVSLAFFVPEWFCAFLNESTKLMVNWLTPLFRSWMTQAFSNKSRFNDSLGCFVPEWYKLFQMNLWNEWLIESRLYFVPEWYKLFQTNHDSLTRLVVLFLNDSVLFKTNPLKEWLIGSLACFVLKWIRMNNNEKKKNCHDVSSGSTTWTWFDHRCDCRLRVKSLVITDIAEAEP